MTIKTTNINLTNKARLFANIAALKRLLKIKGYSIDVSFDSYCVGILMLSKHKGIYIKYANTTKGILQQIQPVTFSDNTFHIK